TTCQMEETPLPVYETALPAAQSDAQSWISELAKQADARSSFNELIDTPIDFSNFIMHRLNVDTLTLDLLAGPTYELMKGSCLSLSELEYHLEEVYKATTDQLDWVNPEGQQYPHNLLQPLPLIPDHRADLSEMELKKILIDKMEGNKSIQRSDEQRNLYKALVEAYDVDKTILASYGELAILKRRREDDDDQEGPSAGSDRGSKRRRERGEHALASTPSEPATGSAGRSTTGTQSRQLSASESAFTEEPTTCHMEEPSHPVFEIGVEDQPIVQTSQHPEWFSQPRKPPTPDRDWNKTLPAVQGSAHIDTLTPELLAGPTYELMRVSCQQYPHNLMQPILLIPDNRGRRVIPFEHFINNDLEYLRGGALSQKYTTSVTKTKAADYGHIKWIEELVLRNMWIQEPLNYDKHALWEVSHWGRKR
nr:hypothetical protein [Tanacetum cinerariifolium]